MKSRAQAARYVEQQFADTEQYEGRLNKGHAYHYGRQDVRALLDYIYGGPPTLPVNRIHAEPYVPHYAPTGWPLGIDPCMDAHAADHGLAHWSAVRPNSNSHWRRMDGVSHACKWDTADGYMSELRHVDQTSPMGPALPHFVTPK